MKMPTAKAFLNVCEDQGMKCRIAHPESLGNISYETLSSYFDLY